MMQSRGQMSESLRLGALLAVAGGFFDAYTYLCRGGVFANAQTGNIVLLGCKLAERNWLAALGYLVPVLAFAAGVTLAEAVRCRSRAGARRGMHWRQIIVLVEAALVAAAAFLPQAHNMAVNCVISFVCALQVETFRKVRGSAVATTMCTGNLRAGTEQLLLWRRTGDADAARKMRHYYAIIAFFLLGALLGSLSAQRLGERALLLACLPLAAVFGMMFLDGEAEN